MNMDADMNKTAHSEAVSPEVAVHDATLDVSVEEAGTLTKLPRTDETNEQWRQILDQISVFLGGAPSFVGEFFQEYKRPILYVALIVGGLIATKAVLAVLDAVNDIPLLSPSFELIGMGYSAWFIYRYLLKASSRQELSQTIESLKDQVLGNTSSKS